MPEQYVLQAPPPTSTPLVDEQNSIPKLYILIGVGVGLLAMLVLGIVLGRALNKPQQVAVTPTPTTTPIPIMGTSPVPTSISEVPTMQFLPGKQYFDDTYVVITKDAPHNTVVLSVARVEQQQGFVENTKVNYFDGKDWNRKVVTTTVPSTAVTTNPLLRSWNTPASVLKRSETQLASIELPEGTISFTSTDLTNEISLQSIPGSTKFIYQGLGSLTYEDDIHPAYIFYRRTYSFNAADLVYLTTPDQLTSDWLLFWDKEGNFYHIDSHKVANPTSAAEFLKIGVREDVSRTVLRTEDVQTGIENNKDKGISIFNADFSGSFDDDVTFPLTNLLSKSDKKTYTWIESVGEASSIRREGRKVSGVGLVEFIRKN